jgi:hypothetical protein
MTFIPSVLSKIDTGNSIIANNNTFDGVYVETTGYNSIQVSIFDTTISGELEIYFSSNLSNISKIYKDNYSPSDVNENFNKSYDIVDKYYKIIYTPSITNFFSITTRLCTNSLNSENNSVNVFDNNTEYTRDAFGKLRVTNPTTLLDIRFPYIPLGSSGPSGTTEYLSNNIQLSIGPTGNGYYTTTQNSNLILGVTGTTSSANYCISQSRNYCSYLPGKSMLIKTSCIMDSGVNSNGVISRVGYFDDNNGLYFEYVADSIGTGNISIVQKNNNIIVNSILQNNWNIDPLNGTGTTGIKLNFTKAQLFVIDFEWLGVGRIRFGFYIYGKIIYCHEIININNLDNPYMSSSNLPIRYMINSSGVGQTASMIQICSTVISEGGYNPIGRPFSCANTSGIPIANNASGELIVLMIRGGNSQGNYYHQNIIPNSINIVDIASNNLLSYKIRIYRDGALPTSSAITWTDVNNNSVVQYSTSSSVVVPTNSIIVNQGFFSGRGTVSYGDLSNVFDNQSLQLTSNLYNISDIFVVSAQMINGNNSTVYADINWNEFY